MLMIMLCEHKQAQDNAEEQIQNLGKEFMSPLHEGRFTIIVETCQECFTEAFLLNEDADTKISYAPWLGE